MAALRYLLALLSVAALLGADQSRYTRLLWSDEFNTPADTPPDPRYWSHLIGNGIGEIGLYGWGNFEMQYYTDAPSNAYSDGAGHMIIEARRLERAGFLDNGDVIDQLCPERPAGGPCRYSSARIHTQGKVAYRFGRIEARIKYPQGDGVWPAFWMLGNDASFDPQSSGYWPQCGEIDIAEYFSVHRHQMGHFLYYPQSPALGHGEEVKGSDFSLDFHTYALEWEPHEIRWYIDGVMTQRIERSKVKEWVFDKPFFLIFNIALHESPMMGDPKNTEFPKRMVIDYVRWYAP
ncbi:MAG: glycoside hydrolase family 16 protein [Campylobacterales bacterium]|nr:glycoside hydrolase family 16 protein [Campylobacterales bacterium]